MKAFLTDAAARRGFYDGIVIGGVVMVLVFVANVVVPVADQDTPLKYVVAWLSLALLAVLFTVIGARGRRLVDTDAAGARAGAVAGLVIAALFVITFVIMDNVFFTEITQQPGKVGFSRAALNATLPPVAAFFLAVTTLTGAALGRFGGVIAAHRTRVTK